MAFDKPTRNALSRAVIACRRLMSEDVSHQLQGRFGMHPDGTFLPVETLTHLDEEGRASAFALRELYQHLYAGTAGREEDRIETAYGRLVLEIAFTQLNRMAALRLCEERELIQECVRKGYDSAGFRIFERPAEGTLGNRYQTYRAFIELLFDELAVDLGILFDRNDPRSAIFPSEPCLIAVLQELDDPDLRHLWKEDETIGWIYQYFNPVEERKAMRDPKLGGSAAPRNSRELAVRNQFFTPRYVVEFLTDNTLGRMWYEMANGETALKDECRYLLRQPNESFLAPGDSSPVHNGEPSPSQEELLKKPIYIEHRAKKDPRDLRVLDPASGSGHFLLYAFDLLERIYQEAWEDPEIQPSEATGKALREDFATADDLRRTVPKLILEHNLHGIDIDPRTAQIAALALWLRAQKSWKRLGLKAAERPRIDRSNIVTAEPMPGEEDMRREFTADMKPRVLGQLVEVVFEKMKLAGEAGSLLRIEEEIKEAVASARRQWMEGPKPEQQFLFPSMFEDRRPQQQELRFDFDGVTDERFWEEAEDRILDALKKYAERAENGQTVRRRLFVEDAARGFAFIDLCRQRYDVVLMNPPFGEASVPSKPYIEETYGDTKGDVYKAFVECFHDRLVPTGYLGVISSRTGFFLGQSEDWRTRVVLRLFRPIALADLGSGVLDAMVEVAAYVLRSLSEREARYLTLSLVPLLDKVDRDKQGRISLPKWQAIRGGLKRHQAMAELEHLKTAGFIQRSPGDIVRYSPIWQSVRTIMSAAEPVFPPFICIRALGDEDKEVVLTSTIHNPESKKIFICDPGSFTDVPGSPFAYWTTPAVRRLFTELSCVEGGGRDVESGASTKSDFRFLRLRFERPETDTAVIGSDSLVRGGTWVPFAKGGAVVSFYGDLNLTVNWRDNGSELKALISEYRGSRGWGYQWTAELKVMAFSFRPGVTWGRRSTALAFRLLPRNSMFADKGPAILVQGDRAADLQALAAVVNSRPFAGLAAVQLARTELAQSFEVGLIQRTPFPKLSENDTVALAALARRVWSEKRALDTVQATSNAFIVPALLTAPCETLAKGAAEWGKRLRIREDAVAAIQAEIDDMAFRLYGLHPADREALTVAFATECAGNTEAAPDEDDERIGGAAVVPALVADLLAYALGAVFGRWDVRFAVGQKPAPPEPDPFDPLPICPPGMLQNADGFPASEGEVPSNYPLRITWSGILVDDPNHPDDIEGRVREAVAVLFPGRADAIEHEICEHLGVKTLRDWFRKPTGFLQDHLKRYTKSHRKAPIFWPLSTASGSYTIWLYYQRLTDQTVYAAVNKHVEPKIVETERGIIRIEEDLKSVSGSEATRLRDRMNEMRTFLSELRDLREELLRIAALPFHPNLNDGVIINAAPFQSLFRLRSWANDTEECWQQLEKGIYDWAHLAYTIWPDRVRDVCRKDRSIAIAHGLEDLFVEPETTEKKPRGRRKKMEKV